jgi:hypothetical protein
MSPAHIPFRLVTIPMGMYSAIDEQDIHLPVACVVIERWITESPTIGLLGQTRSPVFEVAPASGVGHERPAVEGF